MSLKRIGLLLLCVLFVFGTPFVACEGDDGDGDGGDGSDGGGGDTAAFVRVDDESTNLADGSPGADIDAIVLEKADGTLYDAAYAVEHDIQTPSGLSNDHRDQTACYGQPDCDTLPDTCSVSLGGAGGYLFVNYNGRYIENGDKIHVYEASEQLGQDENIAVRVSIAGVDRNFEEIGICLGGHCEYTISGL